MITVFEDIPEIFVEYYDAQFQQWAREFRSRPRRQAIVFDVLPGQIPTLDGMGGISWTGAWLQAQVEGGRVIVRPVSDFDRNLIEMHCWNLKRVMLT